MARSAEDYKKPAFREGAPRPGEEGYVAYWEPWNPGESGRERTEQCAHISRESPYNLTPWCVGAIINTAIRLGYVVPVVKAEETPDAR